MINDSRYRRRTEPIWRNPYYDIGDPIQPNTTRPGFDVYWPAPERTGDPPFNPNDTYPIWPNTNPPTYPGINPPSVENLLQQILDVLKMHRCHCKSPGSSEILRELKMLRHKLSLINDRTKVLDLIDMEEDDGEDLIIDEDCGCEEKAEMKDLYR